MPLEYCLINNWNLSAIFQGVMLNQNEPIKVILFQKKTNQSICNYYEQFLGWKQCKLCLFYKAKNILPWHKDGGIIYFIALLYFADYLNNQACQSKVVYGWLSATWFSWYHPTQQNYVPKGRPEDVFISS